MAKTRTLMHLSGIAEKYEISRQSVRNWVQRHEDFPAPVIVDGAKLCVAGKKGADTTYVVTDPHGRTQFYDATEVEAWVKGHAGLRSQEGTKPKAKAKPAAKGKAKAATKTVKAKAGTKAKSGATKGKAKSSTKAKAAAPVKKGKKKGKKSRA